MNENSNRVWVNSVDKKFDCVVTRTEPGKGILKVSLNGVVLGEKEVVISYDAKFGPDVFDVNDWSEYCIEVVDKYLAENKS